MLQPLLNRQLIGSNVRDGSGCDLVWERQLPHLCGQQLELPPKFVLYFSQVALAVSSDFAFGITLHRQQPCREHIQLLLSSLSQVGEAILDFQNSSSRRAGKAVLPNSFDYLRHMRKLPLRGHHCRVLLQSLQTSKREAPVCLNGLQLVVVRQATDVSIELPTVLAEHIDLLALLLERGCCQTAARSRLLVLLLQLGVLGLPLSQSRVQLVDASALKLQQVAGSGVLPRDVHQPALDAG
mmetsp:Transcript_40703/g.88944  ORF Transcript_40703/g.88944 Transcript_40703/m.88944 type:complete len:239 (+) Transcript_40703:514-1230(+)